MKKTLLCLSVCLIALISHAQSPVGLFMDNMAQIQRQNQVQDRYIHLSADEKRQLIKQRNQRQNQPVIQQQSEIIPAPLLFQQPSTQTEVYNKLKDYIQKKARTDLDKAKMLASYVAGNYKRDGFTQKKLREASKNYQQADIRLINNFEETHIGTSFDFARLYQKLCKLVDLECVIIEGYASEDLSKPIKRSKLKALESSLKTFSMLNDYQKQVYQSAWNGVKIKDKWILIDTYLMVKYAINKGHSFDNERQMNRFLLKEAKINAKTHKNISQLFKNAVNETYFNTPPRTFIKTHYPYDENWQLLPIPTQAPDKIR